VRLNLWEANFGLDNGVHLSDTEADARAKMLIYLLDNGLYHV
jgi:hypothetical protein